MDTTHVDVSGCQRCHHYTPQGRRGGHCSQLNVPVQGKWQPCPLAMPVFLSPLGTDPLGNLEATPLWQDAWQDELFREEGFRIQQHPADPVAKGTGESVEWDDVLVSS